MLVAPVLASLLGLAGCDRGEIKRVHVAGKVLLDGQPLHAGNVRFVPDDGRPSIGEITTDGSFHLSSQTVGQFENPGVPVGTYSVAVSTAHIVDDETATWLAPPKYADHRTSGIVVVVEERTDSLEIQLFSDKGADGRHRTPPSEVDAANTTHEVRGSGDVSMELQDASDE